MSSSKQAPAETRTQRAKAAPAAVDAAVKGEASSRNPLQWVKGLLSQRLRLERRGVQVHVMLDPAKPAAVPSVFADSQSGEALRLAHTELRELLGRHAGTRKVMPHLSHLEQALARTGSRAIGKLPLPVLHRALNQLENLTQDQASEGLAALRQRMLAAIEKRMEKPAPRPAADSDFRAEHKLEVSEASHSLFDEMERSWAGTVPIEDPAAQGR